MTHEEQIKYAETTIAAAKLLHGMGHEEASEAVLARLGTRLVAWNAVSFLMDGRNLPPAGGRVVVEERTTRTN